MKRTLITLFLVLGLFVTFLPVQALAEEPPETQAIDWVATLTATGEHTPGLFVFGSGMLGVAPDAGADNDVLDTYDAPLPPMPPHPAIQTYFDHPAQDFITDIRLPGAALSWAIDVKATFSLKPITITWDVSAVPGEYTTVQLIQWTLNFGNGQWENPTVVVADMRTAAEFVYTNTFVAQDKFTFDISANLPPDVAVTSPNGGEIVSGTVSVTADATDSDGTVAQVDFEYSADGGTTWAAIGVPDTTDPYSVSWDTTGVADGTDYLVRATATDTLGAAASDTSDAVFTVDNTAPSAPMLIAPVSGTSSNNTTPTLDWGDVSDLSGVTYDVQVDDTDDTFGSLVVDESGLASSTHTTAALADGTYHWRARAVEADGAVRDGAWSAIWSFTVDATAPAAPALASPADDALSNDNTPTLDWGDVTDPSGATYDVQVDDTDNTFGSLVVDESGLGTSTYTTAALVDGTYHWRARAIDGVGNTGAWSAAWSFTVDTTPPADPDLISPNDGIITGDNTPTFNWEAVTDPSGVTYGLQVDDTDDTFGSLVIDESGLDITIFVTPDPLADGTYYWRVNAVDGVGNESVTVSWSGAWSFIVDTTAPAAPALVSPSDGTLTNNDTATLDWDDVTDPSGVTYNIQIDNIDDTFGSPFVDASGLGTSTYTTDPLADGTYYWRTRAVDGVGNTGAWSDVWSFTIDTTGPPIPNQTSPADGSLTTNRQPWLNADEVIDPSGIEFYVFEVDSDPGFDPASITIWSYDSIAHITMILPDGTYWWRVRADDNAGNEGAWSEVWTFTVDGTPPEAPDLVSPAHGAFINDSTPSFDWTDATDPAGGVTYGIQVDDTDDTFSSLVIDLSSLGVSAHTALISLPDGTYYWRVNATDGLGNEGDWSAVWSFTIDTLEPSAPILSSPADGLITGDNTHTLDWNDVTDASGVTYDVQVDDTDATFGSLVLDETGLVDSFFDILVPLPDGTYYWRARAVDNSVPSNTGSWSEVWSFTVDTTAPAAPVLDSPADAQTTGDNTPTLDWDDVSDPSGVTYEVQVDDTDDTFGSLVVDEDALGDSFFDILIPLPDGTYYWRARAVDNAVPANTGAWSEVWSFTVDTTAPAAPALASPPDTEIINDNTPALDWDDVTDPSGLTYELQVDNNPEFSSPAVDESGLVGSFFDVLVTLPDGTYYWRVRAVDGVIPSNVGAWSEVWSFTVDTTAPAVPALISPPDGALLNDDTPMLDWGDVSDISGVTYDLHVQAIGLSVSFDVYDLDDSFFDIILALDDDAYTWWVRAVDGMGNVGDWSGARWFTVDTTDPLAPILTSPADEDLTSDNTPSFDWGDVDDPSGIAYSLQVATDAGFASLEIDATGVADSFFDILIPLPDDTYYWRVMAVDGATNQSPWSSVWSFTIDTERPLAPVLVSPLDGALINYDDPTLDWGDVGDPSGVTYNLLVADNPGFVGPELDETGIADSFFDVLVGLPDGTHYWKVKAVDGAGNPSVSSVTWSLTIDTTSPPTPALVSPADGVFTMNSTPALDWSNVSDPSGVTYNLQVATDAEFTSIVLDETGLVDSFFDILVPLPDDTYYWRVEAVDGAGNHSIVVLWTDAWSFTVDTVAPAAPILISPPNGALLPYTPTLDWSDVSDPSDVSYVLRLERASLLLSDPGVSTLTASEYTPGTLSTGTYYWRVKTVDGAGNESGWSPASYFYVDVDPPATPALIAPADEMFINNAGPSLDWEDAPDDSGIVFYTLEVDDSPLFDSLAVDETDIEDSFFDILVELPDGTYYWRVKAVDAVENDSSWSSVWSFTVDTAYPPAPELFTPLDHTYSDDNTPYFDWGGVGDASAVSYLLRVERVTLITAVETLEVLVVESEYTPAPEEALVDGNYYWKVKAIDGAGNEGAWSEAWSFTVDALNPPAPALTSPQDSAVITDTTPTLDWEDVADPTGIIYDIQVSDDGIFAAVVLTKTGLIASQYTLAPGEALADGTYHWRARAIDGAGNPSDWSSDWSFIIDNTGPPIPTLLAPADEALTNDTTPAFDWEGVVEPNGVSYTLMIDDSDTFATPVRTQLGLATSDYTLTVGEALPDGTYYWRVEAVDDFGNPGGWSAVWSFTVDTVGPPTPTLVSPADGISTNDTTPTLDWEDVFDPSEVTYDLQVDDTDDSFGSLVVDETGIDDSFFDILVALPDGIYYWRVEAVDGAGNHNGVILWTEVWTFTVDTAAPAEPTLLLPEDDSYTNDTTPTLDWDNVVDPSGVIYTLEVDDGDTFTSPLFTLIGLGTSEYTLSPGEALPEGTYYWRVMAVDGAGNPSGWSSEWSFTIELTNPDAPVLLLPEDGASIDDGTPNFDWSTVSDLSGVTYTLEIADSDIFSTVVLTKTGVDTSEYTLAIEEALASGTYYWRVKTVDGAGNESGWSDTWSFDLAVSAIIWRADITATGENAPGAFVSGYGTAGVALDADADDDVRDAYDAPVPPMGPHPAIQLYFDHPAEDFSRDVRIPADVLSWEIDVETTFSFAPIVLTWDVSEIPAGYNVVQLLQWSLNTGNGQWENPTVVVADMRTAAEFVYTNTFVAQDKFTFDISANLPPDVGVTYPNGGETVSGTVSVTADATDSDGTVAQVDFEYSPDGGTTWYAIDSDMDGGDGWSVQWNSLLAPYEGSNYLLKATAVDNLGIAASDESDAAFEVVYALNLSITFAAGWNMFSLPVDPEENDFADVLGDDIGSLYVFWYNPVSGGYITWANDNRRFPAEFGKGYWTRVDVDTEVDVVGFPAPETDYAIHLASGWNQIGHPRTYSVDWENVQVTYDGQTVSIEQAHSNNWVLKYLYGYDTTAGSYVNYEAPDGMLEPWHGYLVRALVECDLIIPATPMP
ncbi:hypothetical protein ACFLWV_02360 [Chloroflexota bacterium]